MCGCLSKVVYLPIPHKIKWLIWLFNTIAYGSVRFVRMTLKKMAATLKVYKRDARNVCVRLVKVLVNKNMTFMSHVMHYWVLPWATGLLTLLESVTEAPDRQAAKTGKLLIFWLLLSSITILWQWVKLLQRSKHHFTSNQHKKQNKNMTFMET